MCVSAGVRQQQNIAADYIDNKNNEIILHNL